MSDLPVNALSRATTALSAWLDHPACDVYGGDYLTAMADMVADLLILSAKLGEFPTDVISKAEIYIEDEITDELVTSPSTPELLEVQAKLDAWNTIGGVEGP